ncbi:MAG: 50S ribosomal protein L5 [Candidatus Micrarchaeaceae archaeon]
MQSSENRQKAVGAMRSIFLEKVTLSTGIGGSEDKYEDAKEILKRISGSEPVPAKAKVRKPEFNIRKGQTIGAFVTLRGTKASDLLKRALDAKDNVIKRSSIAGNSLNFGVEEYIYFNGIKYDPKIGMLGLNVNATFARKGMRIERRRRLRSKAKKSHKQISADELADYVLRNYKVKFAEEEA